MVRLAAAWVLGAGLLGKRLVGVGLLGEGLFGMGLLAAGDLGGRGLAVQEVDARELADWMLERRGLMAARELAAGAGCPGCRGIVRVLVARQEPQSGPQRHHTGQLEVRPLGENLDLVDGQGDADFTAPGVQAGRAARG